jgi:hypothetical protein
MEPQKVYLKIYAEPDGHSTAMILNEYGETITGGPTRWARDCVLRHGYEVVGEFSSDEKPVQTFKKRPHDLERPQGLSDVGNVAHALIRAFLEELELTHTGGCKAFYSPSEWRDRGEKYGLESELIVVHDGGSLSRVFNLDYMLYDLNNELQEMLATRGLFCEQCTSWYSAIYKA